MGGGEPSSQWHCPRRPLQRPAPAGATCWAAPLSRLALALYCGASGGHNPIHVDRHFACAAGMPDLREPIDAMGLTPYSGSVQDFALQMQSDDLLWECIIRDNQSTLD